MSYEFERVSWIEPRREIDAACFLCGNRTGNHVALEALHPDPAVGALEVALCGSCGSAWYPAGAEHATSYPSSGDYHEDSDFRMLVHHYIELVGGLDWKVALAERLDSDAYESVLEVGCSVGLLVDYFQREWKLEAVGLEPSAYGAAGAAMLGLPIETAEMAVATSVRGRKFDLLCTTEVLEHVSEPTVFLAQARTLLNPEGTLLLTTPRAGSLEKSTPPGELYAALSVGAHYFLASEEWLRQAVLDAGFGWCHIEPFGMTNVVYASDRPLQLAPLKDATPHLSRYYEGRAATDQSHNKRQRIADLLHCYVHARRCAAVVPIGLLDQMNDALRNEFGIDEFNLRTTVVEVLSARTLFDFGRYVPYIFPQYLYWRGHSSDISETHRTEMWEAAVAMSAHAIRLDPINMFVLRQVLDDAAGALGGRVRGSVRRLADEALSHAPDCSEVAIQPAPLTLRARAVIGRLIRPLRAWVGRVR